jgi:microcystin-dependent protein
MSSPFVAEIRIFAFNFAPTGWAFCDGQLLPIGQNTALFSLLGTTYGGDGKSTFALPNLQGSAPLGSGQGPAPLSQRVLGEVGGEQTVTLNTAQIPIHSHTAQAATTGGLDTPINNLWGESKLGKTPMNVYAATGTNNVAMSAGALAPAGDSYPHNNMPPYLCLNFVIALQGIFPPRS